MGGELSGKSISLSELSSGAAKMFNRQRTLSSGSEVNQTLDITKMLHSCILNS